MHFIIKIRSIFAITGFVLINGCAFGTREVILRNTEVSQIITPSEKRNHNVCFDSLEDQRKEKTVGHVQNTYGVHTADVIAKNDVAEWVNKEIENRLKISGYEVKNGCDEGVDAIVVKGKILKAYTTAYLSYLGEVTIDVSINFRSKKILRKQYSAHQKTGTNWAATEGSFQNTLEKSLTITVSKMIADIDSLDKIDDYDRNLYSKLQSAVPFVDTSLMLTNKAALDDSSVNASSMVRTPDPVCPEKSGDIKIVFGNRSIESIKKPIDSIRTELRGLFQDRYELKPNITGHICVYFEISRKGRVENIKILKNALNDIPMEEELLKLLSDAKFKTVMKNVEETGVTYTFKFSNASARDTKAGIAVALVLLGLVSTVISLIFAGNPNM